MTILRRAPSIGDRNRAEFLDDVRETLWPADAAERGGTELLLLPGRDRPRLLVPPERRAAAAAVRQYGEPRSRRAQLGVRALSLLLRSGAGGAVFRDRVSLPTSGEAASIESYLRREVARDLRISMYLGAPRANRKPVLQLLRPSGELIGVAKIGITPLARRLVAAEHDALALLAGHRFEIVRPPDVLHYGHWSGMPVLVIRPLPIRARRISLPALRLTDAMHEVSAVRGSPFAAPAAAVIDALTARLARTEESMTRSALEAALDRLGEVAGDRPLDIGAWHGDWTPWNMAHTRTGLLLWDWERFGSRAPVGFDAAHHWLQRNVTPGRREPRAAAAECVRQAAAILASMVPDPAAARVTALLYLAELASRQLADGQAQSGARLGDAARWLVPALTDQVAAL